MPSLPEAISYRPDDHFAIVAEWWDAHWNGECPLPRECIPTTGGIAIVDGVPAAASFIYLGNAAMAFLAFTCCAQGLRPLNRSRAVMTAMKKAVSIGRAHVGERGFIWSCTNNDHLARIYPHLGFTPAGKEHAFFLPCGDLPADFML